MKKALDFSRVPLNKWVDFFTKCQSHDPVWLMTEIDDIEQFATVEVKEEADINAEIVAKLEQLTESESTPDRLTLHAELTFLLHEKKAIKESENIQREDKKSSDGGKAKT